MTIFADDYEPIVVSWNKEIWLLDPGPFIDIAFDIGMVNFVFRSQFHETSHKSQNFTKFIDMYARGRPWRVLWMPYPGNYCVLFTSIEGWDRPVAVWPIWRATEHKLEEMTEMFYDPPKTGEILGTYGIHSRVDSRPVAVVEGQARRLIVANAPPRDADWAIIVNHALRLQMTEPDTNTIHFHGQKSVGRTIGVGVKSFDHPVRLAWRNGFPQVLLPNGMYWNMELKPTVHQKQWLKIVGVNPINMSKVTSRDTLSRETYRVNLLSLRWAFLNWDRAWDFRRMQADEMHLDSPERDWQPETIRIRMRHTKKENHLLDRWQCDTCSLQFKCPYSREGAVCIVPDSEPAELAQFFNTRSSSQIIEGLGLVLAAQAHRANRGMRAENAEPKDDADANESGLKPEVTRILKILFDQGLQLAKLVDPKLAARMAPKLQIGTFNNSMIGMGNADIRDLMEGVRAELESQGIDLAEATPDAIAAALGRQQIAIEASATEETQS